MKNMFYGQPGYIRNEKYYNIKTCNLVWSNTIFNNLFYINIKFDQLLSEIDNVLQKKEFNLTM